MPTTGSSNAAPMLSTSYSAGSENTIALEAIVSQT